MDLFVWEIYGVFCGRRDLLMTKEPGFDSDLCSFYRPDWPTSEKRTIQGSPTLHPFPSVKTHS